MINDYIDPWFSSFVPTTPLRTLAMVIATPLVLTFTIVSLIALRYTILLVWNVFTDYFRLGRYSSIPRAQHKGTWLQLLHGDMRRILDLEPAEAHREFVKESGGSEVLLYRHLFWAPRLLLADAGAMLYVLGAQQSYSFPKPEITRSILRRAVGDGVLVVEGNKHRSQRKIIQPAFSTSAIRELVPSFFWHARRLTDRFGRAVDACHDPSNTTLHLGQKATSGKLHDVFDVSRWITRCTLDIIGDAGFDWQFDSILKVDVDRTTTMKDNRLSEAFERMMTNVGPTSALEIALVVLRQQLYLGWLNYVRLPFEAQMDRVLGLVQELSQEIIDTKRRQIQVLMAAEDKGGLSKADFEDDGSHATGGKDLLFHMMRSNMSTDLADSERMTDAELLGQMTTLLLAGHETTATLLSWALLMLADHPHVQTKLRNEIRAWANESGREEVSFDELGQLPYLEAVLKETLRMRTPVPASRRVAEHDTVIPLSRPYPKGDGTGTMDHVLMRKGEEVILPLLLINTSETLWGPDALAFRPERWFNVPEPAKKSGMPLHLMSFISGPRSCIGNRFALAEAKVLLFSLIRAFEFSKVEGWEIGLKQTVVMRAFVKGRESEGFQCPLHVRRATQS